LRLACCRRRSGRPDCDTTSPVSSRGWGDAVLTRTRGRAHDYRGDHPLRGGRWGLVFDYGVPPTSLAPPQEWCSRHWLRGSPQSGNPFRR
jgi:hypothetical protein